MASLPPLSFRPPLLNSASPWATTFDDLASLYALSTTGAVTVRTSLLHGFNHDPAIHQYTYFSVPSAASSIPSTLHNPDRDRKADETSSLNTLGYSPLQLASYLDMIPLLPGLRRDKPIILSVTGPPEDIQQCYAQIAAVQARHADQLTLGMEINLSCPNIADKPPPAYDGASLSSYLDAVRRARDLCSGAPIYVGIKTPPYTYQGQFDMVRDALKDITMRVGRCPIHFISATNTLGGCLVLTTQGGTDGVRQGYSAALKSASGTGIGGMAGAALHPLALGNVASLRSMLDEAATAAPSKDEGGKAALRSLKDVLIIGIGGVGDAEGYRRMRSVGAGDVALATGLGREGIGIFEKILGGV